MECRGHQSEREKKICRCGVGAVKDRRARWPSATSLRLYWLAGESPKLVYLGSAWVVTIGYPGRVATLSDSIFADVVRPPPRLGHSATGFTREVSRI
ncbi:uncharacterized protein LOC100278616 [Zea mays]|uniref:Uncharacterized protein n=1 Tax=Zea mays TaxID=4577 RepID=B6UBE3_MAIZE|nr:uncharacterized protein LOC100278616 [Zea mays]ACG46676.1 hypothetical protein [Zea mays]|eukprot:NP_001145309.1 uncharacterized protein LOC100278616 [Zea mays]